MGGGRDINNGILKSEEVKRGGVGASSMFKNAVVEPKIIP
jgi:hypothetical protein